MRQVQAHAGRAATTSTCHCAASVCRLSRAAGGPRIARGTLDLDLPERKVDTRRCRPRCCSVLPAPAPGQPPADRGVHGAGQRRRGRGTGAAAPAVRCTACMPRRRRKSSRRCARSWRHWASRCRPAISCTRATSTAVLRRVAGTAEAPLVNEVMLRSQSQAAYSADNIGHFGLALTALRAFHQPDPPLCRSAGAPRADRAACSLATTA